MSETGLLEERWRQTQSLAGEVAWLAERCRVGDLPLERLRLAGYCGYKAAKQILGADCPSIPGDTHEWALGLAHWGKEVCIRALGASAESVLNAELEDLDRCSDPDLIAEVMAALGPAGDALVAVLACAGTTDATSSAASQAALTSAKAAYELASSEWGANRWCAITLAVYCTARATAADEADAAREAADGITALEQAGELEHLVRGLRDLFIPWALRYPPPPEN